MICVNAILGSAEIILLHYKCNKNNKRKIYNKEFIFIYVSYIHTYIYLKYTYIYISSFMLNKNKKKLFIWSKWLYFFSSIVLYSFYVITIIIIASLCCF